MGIESWTWTNRNMEVERPASLAYYTTNGGECQDAEGLQYFWLRVHPDHPLPSWVAGGAEASVSIGHFFDLAPGVYVARRLVDGVYPSGPLIVCGTTEEFFGDEDHPARFTVVLD